MLAPVFQIDAARQRRRFPAAAWPMLAINLQAAMIAWWALSAAALLAWPAKKP